MRNVYNLLRDLLPDPPLQVGTVTALSNGVATIETPGGGTTTARGDTTVGARVFFRNDVIEGPAPTLTVELIEV